VPVNTPRKDYQEMLSQWERARDCYDGSDAVKAAGPKYLPKLDSHKGLLNVGAGDKYEEYKMRALFYNATGRTVEGLGGALFQSNPSLEIPPALEPHLEDITLTGTSFNLFGLEIARELLITGRYGLLVDMPSEEENDRRGYIDIMWRRPYWIGVRAENIISWKTTRIEGREVITLVVIREIEQEEDAKDRFEIDDVEQFRVLELDSEGLYSQTVWRKVNDHSDKWAAGEPVIPTRRGEPLSFIPFMFVGPTSVTSEVQKPPLIDLVDVNLSHYRTSAQLEHGLHFTALPTPWISGLSGNANQQKLYMGSGVAWKLEKGGQAGMLEFSGAGLGALRSAEQDKRKIMATLGARLLEGQAETQETATAVSMRHAGDRASLRSIAQTTEFSLSQALRVHTWWISTELMPSDLSMIKCELNKDFFKVRMQPAELQALTTALQSEVISYDTFYANLQKGEITRPGVDAQGELDQIDARSYSEGPLPGDDPSIEELPVAGEEE